jgi:carboxylate-amine ligase
VASTPTTRSGAGHWASWQPSAPYTIGVEEEVMLLDPGTWRLAQRADDVLALLGDDLAGHCSAETHEAALELATGVHATVAGAIADLGRLRAQLGRDARSIGLAIAAAGMHPGRMAEDPQVSSSGRYQLVHRTMRGIARREPTFALHVHIGVADPESAIRLLNRLRAHLPMLLALSATSPLWQGRATGLASNRTILFQAFPRTGVPRAFDGYADWADSVDLLMRSGAIPEPTFLWWDVRPQPRFGTVEVRVMDAQPRLEATGALCALVQALARLELEEGFAAPELVHGQEVLAENRFLAARDGVAAELIDPVRALRVPVAEQLAEVLMAAAPHASVLGAADELARVPSLVTSSEAARQEAHATRAGIRSLVSDLADDFTEGGAQSATSLGPPPASTLPAGNARLMSERLVAVADVSAADEAARRAAP